MPRLTPEQRQRAGDALKNRRAELGWTQQELTRKAHVASDRVSVFERAEEWPQTRTGRAIEDAVGWRRGAMLRIARGESEPAEEVIGASGTEQPEADLEDYSLDGVVLRIMGYRNQSNEEKRELILQIFEGMPFSDATRRIMALTVLSDQQKRDLISRLPLGATGTSG